MKISQHLFIDMYTVSNKVEGAKFESEVKTGNGSSFSRHFGEKQQKRPIIGLWPRISKIRQDTISICLSFSIKPTARNSNLKRKPETEVVSSAILKKNCRKRRKIAGN